MKKSLRTAACILHGLIFFVVLSFPARAQNKRITLQLKNVSLIAVMDSIQEQAGYRFSYNLALLPLLQQNRVTIRITDAPIEKVLDQLFAGKGIK
jgi:DNA-binding TFAR19-related protein (PDSD5 family)